jgi:hypothetical protein
MLNLYVGIIDYEWFRYLSTLLSVWRYSPRSAAPHPHINNLGFRMCLRSQRYP